MNKIIKKTECHSGLDPESRLIERYNGRRSDTRSRIKSGMTVRKSGMTRLQAWHDKKYRPEVISIAASVLIVLSLAISQAHAAGLPIVDMTPGAVVQLGAVKLVKLGAVGAAGPFVSVTPANMFMQTWDGCASITTPVGLAHSTIVTLTDARDGKQYRVAKFADGNCWMIDNLKYGGDRTDACAGKTTFNGCGNNKGDYCGGTSSAPGTGVSLYGFWTNGTSTSINQLYGDCRDSAAGASGYCATNDCGYYYSWQAAMQDATAYYNNSSFVQPTEPIQGICPEGWILPTNAGNTSFQNLANLAGATSTNFWQRDLTTADPSIGFLGLYSGLSYATGGLGSQGGNGYFWSSTSISLSSARYLGFNSANAYPTVSNDKYYGFSVRCLQN